mgnify:CR=1 FL=1
MFLFFLKAIGLTFVFNFVLNLIASIILVRLDYNTKFKAKVNSVVSQILFSTLNLILYLFILKMAKSDFNVEMLSRNNLLAIIGDLIFCQVLLNYSAKGIMNEMKKNYDQLVIEKEIQATAYITSFSLRGALVFSFILHILLIIYPSLQTELPFVSK